MLTCLTAVIISLWICVSKHHVVHLRCIQIKIHTHRGVHFLTPLESGGPVTMVKVMLCDCQIGYKK